MRRRRCVQALLISIVLTFLLPAGAAHVGAASGNSARNDLLIELTWTGDMDLDLHVTGLLDKEERFSVWRLNRIGPGCRLESEAGPGGGVERVRISEGDHGPYQVYVYDSSGSTSGIDKDFAGSAAQVKVFNGSGLKDAYDVPEAGYGNLWSVCAINGNEVTPLNEMSAEDEPGLIGRDPESTLIPGDILLGTQPDTNVPTKWSHVGMYIGDGKVVEAYGTSIPTEVFTISDWEYPEMAYVSYYRVSAADADTRKKAVEFVLEEVRKEAPYDIGFHTKQADGGSWYCTELVWAAYLHASDGKINIEDSPDRLGVYPWEIEHSDCVALVGGHYEKYPDRNWFKMAWVGIKRLFQYVLFPTAGRLAVSMAYAAINPLFILFFFLFLCVAVWYRINTKKPV